MAPDSLLEFNEIHLEGRQVAVSLGRFVLKSEIHEQPLSVYFPDAEYSGAAIFHRIGISAKNLALGTEFLGGFLREFQLHFGLVEQLAVDTCADHFIGHVQPLG